MSATYRNVPLPQTSLGAEKRASAPTPSIEPDAPAVPANVVTSPVVITILRIVLLFKSLTYRLTPSPQIPLAKRKLNRAALPPPSALPDWPGVPASVRTSRVVRFTVRMVESSKTYRCVPSPQIPPGEVNRAADPM